MTPLEIGFVGLAALLLLLTSSIPVGFVMALVGILGFAAVLGDPGAAMSMAASDLCNTFANYNLSVIPLFIFMGQIAFHSGMSRRLFHSAHCWLGGLRGGLAMATVGASTIFGAICGSGPATAATMASVALPEMKRYGYSLELATGSVAAGGSIGMLIPPSVVFIVYGVMSEQSVGALFMAGILPGLMIATLFCAAIALSCRRRPELAPPVKRVPWSERLRSLLGASEAVLLFALVIGGLFKGFFTPTEAAAIGAAGTIVLALLRRQLSWQGFVQALRESARTSCMVMLIVAGAVIFGHFLAVTRIPFELAGWLGALPLPPWCIMSGIIAFFLLGGCFVDALALILLTIPIFLPIVTQLGYDPIWFGVIVVVVTQMGVISPPVGVNAYIVSGMERDVSLQTVFRGILPFLAALVLAAAILLIFPQVCLFLPGLMP